MKYQTTIGLEIHAELKTKTKMFCASKNDSNEKHPNINICPICTGHPGTLPVINQEAVRHVQRTGLALGGNLQNFSQFDRKNYFYPDLPKGYQISQYKYPLVLGGMLNNIRITRIHLEEDTARLIHDLHTGESLVDFNRAGVPLMELVTEPDITSAQEALEFAQELQLIFQYIGVSDANLEKGEMRCEANISIRPETQKEFGTKVEVKNLNSFRAVEKAIEYEIKRQTELLEKGKKVVQETRGWDEKKEVTFSQRVKESEHDYRYFPEPDLPPMEFSDQYFDELKRSIPELPAQKRKRFKEEYHLDEKLIGTIVQEKDLAGFWESVVSELKNWIKETEEVKPTSLSGLKDAMKTAANYFTSDLLGLIKEKGIPPSELLLDAENFAELIKMIVRKEITSRAAKDVLRTMVEKGGDPSNIVEEQGLGQVSDTTALEEVAKKIISRNPKAVADYKTGKQNSIQFLVGQVMRETKGAANPEVIKDVLTKIMGGV